MKRLLITLFLLVPFFTFAQFKGGLGAGYMAAIGDFSRTHGSGFNVVALGEYEFDGFSILGELGYNSFFAKDDRLLPIEDVSGMSFTTGIHAVLKDPVYVEMRIGYYFGDFGDTALVFAPGLRFDKFDVNFGVNFLAPIPFFNLRFGYLLFGE